MHNLNNNNQLIQETKHNRSEQHFTAPVLTGKGTNSSPDDTNGLSTAPSIIFQSSCTARAFSAPSSGFRSIKYGNLAATLQNWRLALHDALC
jgi:hypothetical protein